MLKARKRIQDSGHIHFEYILFFRVSSGYLNLKKFEVVSGIDSELWHIQDPRYIPNPVNILCENKNPVLFRTLYNPDIFRTLPYLEPEEYSEFRQASMCSIF